MKIQFFPIDATYKLIGNKPIIHLFGKTVEGKQLCVIYEDFKPYFYVIPKESFDIKEQLEAFSITQNNEVIKITKVEEVRKWYVGREVLAYKVFTQLPQHVPILREEVKKVNGISSINENDILFFRRFLIDFKIVPLELYDVEGEFVDNHLRVPTFRASSFKRSDVQAPFRPKILSVDIETYTPLQKEIDPQRNPILMLAFYGENFKKVYTWKRFHTKNDYVEFVSDEQELLKKFREAILEYQPDILAGYYSDGFDLPYITTRAQKFKIKLDIGIDYSEIKFKQGVSDSVQIIGVTHFDAFKFIKKVMYGSLNTDRYNLNSVSEELLGEKKIEVDLDDLSDVWDHAPDNLDIFCEYNLHDAKLCHMLAEKLLPNISELVKMTGLPMFDVNRMGFSQLVEWYLLRQAPDYNQIAPNKPNHIELAKRKSTYIKGAFVFEPEPGLYNDIVIFDYLSLYPTIIGSHNLSGENAHRGMMSEPDGKLVPLEGEQLWFSQRRKGFLPTMIENIIKRRMEVKEEIKHASQENAIILDARQYGLKLLANSFYGYLGFYGARWYSLEAAEATTAFGRYYIKKVISSAQEKNFKVIYSDTDSVFLKLDGRKKQDALDFADEINKELPGLMELEFDGFYPAGIFVSAKASGGGAKKRYALISEDGQIIIKGFESVRRNTSLIAKEVQERVFEIILKEQDPAKAMAYAKATIDDIKQKRVPLQKMTISIQLQKEIDQYDAKGPHVAVAQRLRNQGIHVGPGSAISFIVTSGNDIIRNRAKFPQEVKEGDYDAEYYIQNQVVPSIERIFNVLGYRKEDLLHPKEQTKLSGFFS